MSHQPVPHLPADAPKAGEQYRHYKGDMYKIIGLALNSDNNAPEEWLVVYEPMYENAAAPLFSRPLKHWHEVVEWQDQKLARFSRV